MTLGELIVFNSTIPEGGGTFLEHLQNIRVNREAVNSFDVDISSDTIISGVKDDIMSINIQESSLNISIEDDKLNINQTEDEIGVSI